MTSNGFAMADEDWCFGLRGGLDSPSLGKPKFTVLQKRGNGLSMADEARKNWPSGVTGLDSPPLRQPKYLVHQKKHNGLAMAEKAW